MLFGVKHSVLGGVYVSARLFSLFWEPDRALADVQGEDVPKLDRQSESAPARFP